MTNPDGQNVSVSFDSNETLDNISVDISGSESATLTEEDFAYDATTGTYTATYEGSNDGTYNATLETAEDAAGNDGATGQSDETTVDTTDPSISGFDVSSPGGQNVSVSFDSDEQLTNIGVNVSGAEDATLTESDFAYDAANGTYTATYEGSSDGTYDATLETAGDSAGNDGAAGQSDSVTVGTTDADDGSSSRDADDDSSTGSSTRTDDEETTVEAQEDNGTETDGDDTGDEEVPAASVNVSNPDPDQTLLINDTGATVLEDGQTEDSDTPGDGQTEDSDAPENVSSNDSDEETPPNIKPDQLEVDLNTSEDFELQVQTHEDDLTPSETLMAVGSADDGTGDDTPEMVEEAADSFENETDTVAAGYVRINTTLDADEVDDATVGFSIRRDYLEELGVAPEAVTLHHQVDDGEWEVRETAYLESGDTYHRFEGEMAEFSVFALGTGAPTTEVTDASLEETTVEPGEPATATVALTNRGQTTTEETVQLTHDGDVVDGETLALEGGETAEVTLTFTPDATGEHDLSVGTTDLETLTVESGQTATETQEHDGTETKEDGPGFGTGVALAALCGAGYLLRRRHDGSA